MAEVIHIYATNCKAPGARAVAVAEVIHKYATNCKAPGARAVAVAEVIHKYATSCKAAGARAVVGRQAGSIGLDHCLGFKASSLLSLLKIKNYNLFTIARI